MRWRRRGRATESSGPLWLVKDDPEQSWWCKCPLGIVDASYHDELTWPTDGNGWLFTCVDCGKAFMFARAARIPVSLEALAARETPRSQRIVSQTGEVRVEVSLATAEDWLEKVRPLAAGLELGRRYVFFDGHIFAAVPGPVKFRGLWRSHDLPDLPHLDDRRGEEILMNADYWSAERH